MIITHITGELYLEGEYKIRDLEKTNWAQPVDCPTVLLSEKNKVKRGDWYACTAINTPRSLAEFYSEITLRSSHNSNYDIPYPSLTDTERYEFGGLTYAIASLNDAWGVLHGGNHGTSQGTDITHKKAADLVLESLEVPIKRANELLAKMRG